MDFLNDRSWMYSILNRHHSEIFQSGVKKFIECALENIKDASVGVFPCPCKKCSNRYNVTPDEVFQHVIVKGFTPNYYIWVHHGEPIDGWNMSYAHEKKNDDIHVLLRDIHGDHDCDSHYSDQPNDDKDARCSEEEPVNKDADKFYKLLKDADEPLYNGCTRYNKLSFIVKLLHFKVLFGWSNKSLTQLLLLFKDVLPYGSENLPSSYYEAKLVVEELGLHYKKIDACPNDCMLFWKDSKDKEKCDHCGASRYTTNDAEITTRKKVPAKILRHFPLIPRLQRMFMNENLAKQMRWHKDERVNDGLLRHPADSLAWSHMDSQFPAFARDPRNVKLGLASDGFNPFGIMNNAYSIWPVIVIPYNLPPWLCMKQQNFILTLLIPGKRSPGKDIDVYMQPLVDELEQLWFGVVTYDSYSKKNFSMRAMLLWTINDFPAYEDLSGWSTKGRLACPICHKDTLSIRLRYGKKQAFCFHRSFLKENHSFRFDRTSFDGKVELRSAPKPLSGTEIIEELKHYKNHFGKKCLLGKRSRVNLEKDNAELNVKFPHAWKKLSIFFQLPYWEHLLIRHNLDVMHIEKNICESILNTLLHISGRSKDNIQSHLDLKEMGIREDLWPQTLSDGRLYLPSPCYLMSKIEKDSFFSILSSIKVPDGYSSNISRKVNLIERKMTGLKSHDYHILMQQLLSVAIRDLLSDNVSLPLVRLCSYFNRLCSKVIDIEDFSKMEEEIVVILCELERIFPPSFFTIMMHLPVHLAFEAKIAGPVHYRWMYPIERYLLTLKKYVRNKSRPEGSIAEGYLIEECLTFCSRYFTTESKLNRQVRSCDESIIGGGRIRQLSKIKVDQAHRYILFNTTAFDVYRSEHKAYLRSRYPRISKMNMDRRHYLEFPYWVNEHVSNICSTSNVDVSEEIKWLSLGPFTEVVSYDGYIINGCRFHCKRIEANRKTQNSGVHLSAASGITQENISYYGQLDDVVELKYGPNIRIILFECNWFDEDRLQTDKYGFTSIDFERNKHKDDPFILAVQAQQCFYIKDNTREGQYHIIVKVPPRDLFDMPIDGVYGIGTIQPSKSIYAEINTWMREDIPGEYLIPQ